VAVGVAVGAGVPVGVAVGVAVGVTVGVAVGVGVGVNVARAVRVAVGVAVGVRVAVGVAVGVGVGVGLGFAERSPSTIKPHAPAATHAIALRRLIPRKKGLAVIENSFSARLFMRLSYVVLSEVYASCLLTRLSVRHRAKKTRSFIDLLRKRRNQVPEKKDFFRLPALQKLSRCQGLAPIWKTEAYRIRQPGRPWQNGSSAHHSKGQPFFPLMGSPSRLYGLPR